MNLKLAPKQTEPAFSVQPQVAPSLQETKGDIFQGPDPVWKGFAKQTALGHQLKDDMSNLQQVVEYLAGGFIFTIGVFQGKAAIILAVKALVFNLPT